MRKYILLFALIAFMSCSGSKGLTNEKKIIQVYNSYTEGKVEALSSIILTYTDQEVPIETRLIALRYMIKSKDPRVFKVLTLKLEDPGQLDRRELSEILNLIGRLEDPKWTPILMKAYIITLRKNISIQNKMLGAIHSSVNLNQVNHYLELYEISKENYLLVEKNLTKTLGKFDDESVVPVLIKIVNDKERDLKIRESALNMLSRKKDPQIERVLTKLIGTPENDLMIRDFAFNVLETGQEEKILLSLLGFLEKNKDREYKMMSTVIDALGNYENPKIIPSLHFIYETETFRRELRKKALDGLLKFNRTSILDKIITTSSELGDYTYWPEISEAVARNGNEDLRQKLESLALSDYQKLLGASK